jgi:hypothetical protein
MLRQYWAPHDAIHPYKYAAFLLSTEFLAEEAGHNVEPVVYPELQGLSYAKKRTFLINSSVCRLSYKNDQLHNYGFLISCSTDTFLVLFLLRKITR